MATTDTNRSSESAANNESNADTDSTADPETTNSTDVEAPAQNNGKKSFWRDRPKSFYLVGLFVFAGIVGIILISYAEVTTEDTQTLNCNKLLCKAGTQVLTGISTVIGGISTVVCQNKFRLSCGVSGGL